MTDERTPVTLAATVDNVCK